METKNKKILLPSDIYFWWTCPTCGHAITRSYEDTAEAGSPYCPNMIPEDGICDSEMELANDAYQLAHPIQ